MGLFHHSIKSGPAAALLCVALLTLLVLSSPVAAAPSPPKQQEEWRRCVLDIGKYFVPLNATAFGWAPDNDCGYSTLDLYGVRRQVFFPNLDGATFSFAGDSTGLRAYINSVNQYHPPANLPITRVAMSPLFTSHNDTDRITRKVSSLRYYRLMYLSAGEDAVTRAITTSNGGLFVLMVGNWDLNWKIQKKMPMPGLVGGAHNFTAAKVYWTTYVRKMFARIDILLNQLPEERRPLIIFREQFLPNCAASRFSAKKNKYRECAPLIRPIVVPMYRRVLAATAWSMNIPVIPTDHFFRDGFRYCAISDGIHLNAECMLTELQHIWAVYLLMRRHKVVQGLKHGVADPLASHAGSDAGDGEPSLPNPERFVDIKYYSQWLDATNMRSAPLTSTATLKKLQDELLEGNATGQILAHGVVGGVIEPEDPSTPSPQSEQPEGTAKPMTVIETSGPLSSLPAVGDGGRRWWAQAVFEGQPWVLVALAVLTMVTSIGLISMKRRHASPQQPPSSGVDAVA